MIKELVFQHLKASGWATLKGVGLFVCFVLIGGCSFMGKRVNAFEKQDLSRPGMGFIEHPIEEVAVQHMFNAREGSVGGFGGAGGGCGCN